MEIDWARLARGAWAARTRFMEAGLMPGDRLLLLLPTGEPYINALFGALWAGITPSTFYPLARAGTAAERELRDLISAFAPKAIVAGADLLPQRALHLLPEAFLAAGDTELPAVPDFSTLRPLSYMQFTSGSTGQPRGLALYWSAIAANLEAIAHATGMPDGQSVASWLPMYHDMGIFGGLLATLHAGSELTLMDPSVFVANPLSWLRIIHEHRATITVTPPSALRACIQLLRRRPRPGPDLSCLQQVLCGAEPIPPGLARSFAETFGALGVPSDAFRPVYGLAEATLAVTFTPRGRGARIDRVQRDVFDRDGAACQVSAVEEPGAEWVSAGRPLAGIEVRVLNGSGEPLPHRRVGNVWIRSPSLYGWSLQEGSRQERIGEWLDTGDLGYLADGELYVTGRRKDLIIRNGRNHSPERLEQLAALVDGVRRCAAFGVFEDARATERIVLMLEAHPRHMRSTEARDELRLLVRGELQVAGYQVDDIRLVESGTLPLTTSGKVRRWQCRDLYLRADA